MMYLPKFEEKVRSKVCEKSQLVHFNEFQYQFDDRGVIEVVATVENVQTRETFEVTRTLGSSLKHQTEVKFSNTRTKEFKVVVEGFAKAIVEAIEGEVKMQLDLTRIEDKLEAAIWKMDGQVNTLEVTETEAVVNGVKLDVEVTAEFVNDNRIHDPVIRDWAAFFVGKTKAFDVAKTEEMFAKLAKWDELDAQLLDVKFSDDAVVATLSDGELVVEFAQAAGSYEFFVELGRMMPSALACRIAATYKKRSLEAVEPVEEIVKPVEVVVVEFEDEEPIVIEPVREPEPVEVIDRPLHPFMNTRSQSLLIAKLYTKLADFQHQPDEGQGGIQVDWDAVTREVKVKVVDEWTVMAVLPKDIDPNVWATDGRKNGRAISKLVKFCEDREAESIVQCVEEELFGLDDEELGEMVRDELTTETLTEWKTGCEVADRPDLVQRIEWVMETFECARTSTLDEVWLSYVKRYEDRKQFWDNIGKIMKDRAK